MSALEDIRFPLRCDWPLPGEYVKRHGDPLSLSIWLSSVSSRAREVREVLKTETRRPRSPHPIPPARFPSGTDYRRRL